MLTLAKPVADHNLVEAISLLCSPVFGALSMANALGGADTDVWLLVRQFSLAQLIDEAVARGLDLSSAKASCCDVLLYDTPPFHAALGYDQRPRCALCCRPHWTPKDGSWISCGDAVQLRGKPNWRWTRATAELAVEGKYP